MTLLMVLIWSFHLQYDQPASFYLKAPTILWIFIFIALRALALRLARFVVLSGLVAATSWILMVALRGLRRSRGHDDHAGLRHYLTSNSVLIGAEVDKILTIIGRHRHHRLRPDYGRKSLLVRAVAEQTAAQELSRFFAPEIAAKIKGSEREIHAGTGEMRDAAVLNLDMRGFTRFAAEAPPDAVMGLLSEYQAQVVPVIQKHGGSIDKFLGDGIMATFGAAAPSTSYAADSLRALQETMAATERWAQACSAEGRPCPRVNGSVATGKVLFGAVGDETRLEYTVIGDAVNLSAKLEKQNKELGVRAVCDRVTYDRAIEQGYQDAGQLRHVPSALVAGVDHPVDLVVVAP